MPAYIPITESQTDPGAPGTSELWKQWRDNPIAMFEGEAGAPRLLSNAHPNFLAGATILDRCTVPNVVATVAGPQIVIPFHFTAMKSGTLRFFLEWRRVSGGSPIQLDILQDGVSAATTTTSSATFVSASLDVAVTAGSNYAFQLNPQTAGTLEYRNIQIRANTRGTYRT